SLLKTPNTINGIVNEIQLTYSSVSSNINKLEKKGYIYKRKGKFYISNVCNVFLNNILDFNKSINLIKNFENFWSNHIITAINLSSLINITCLNDSKLIESTPTDIYKPHNYMKNLIINSKKIKAIFPYLHPDYPKILEELMENEAKIELIIPKNIENQLIENIDKKIIKKSLNNENLIIKTINGSIDLFLTVNSENMNLGLFKIDGSYDQNRLLSSNNFKAVEWGLKLFENFDKKYTGGK
ncbi:DUF1724 domain-containing protein, partial [Methanobrevibacter sp. OttesenSCG-928-I08]|nr:DUF1724 domain-containing protein [Methanobrevibacter sp. OttesenSCG-928-I08]